MNFPSRLVVATVLTSLVVGACGGVAASIYTSNALDDYARTLLGERGFTALEPRKPNANPLDYQQALRHVRDTQGRSLAVIMAKSTDTVVPERWLDATDGSGLGMVVSANGWILTTATELDDFQNPVTGAEVWVRDSRYQIEEMVADKLTDFVLLKLVDASGLTPVSFGASEDSRSGDMMFVLSDAAGIHSSSLAQSDLLTLFGPQPAETYTASWSLSESLNISGPVLSSVGDLLGFAQEDGQALPLHYGEAFVQDIIRSGEVAHAAIGAYVVDLSSIYNLDPALRQGLSVGALILAPTGKLPVPVRTPAADAGLMANDIITAVEGEALTPNTSLAEILSAYDPAQTARLSVLRGGAPIEVEIIFGDAGTLVY